MTSPNYGTMLKKGVTADEVRENTYCEAVNYRRFYPELDSMPFERHQDLAVVYYVQRKSEKGIMTIPVTYEMLSVLGISVDEIKTLAWDNTLRKKPAVMRPLHKVIGVEEKSPLYMLTNKDMHMGAITMLYPSLLDAVSEELESDLCIIPSSIHECLVLPLKGEEDLEKVRNIVQKINDEEVSDEDILSYNIYRYNKARKSLIIDNT